jgi:hypothetical protein
VLVAKIDVTANANDAFLNACMYVCSYKRFNECVY